MLRTVIKNNGEREFYQQEKIIQSLEKIGAEKQTIEEILYFLDKNLPSVVTTKEIFNKIFNFLEERNRKLKIKYNLKNAIALLGPAGYSFEKFFAKIISHYGYQAQTNLILKGKCLPYEIDILAEQDGLKYLIECKFHQFFNKKNDIKTILYVYGRYLDLKVNFPQSILWLVTNTKFTSETIKFANCYKIKLTSWNYPLVDNLPILIERNHLYPVTILTCCHRNVFSQLVKSGIILVSDLLKKDRRFLQKITSLTEREIAELIEEAKILL
jgi:hypothetical protein